MIINPARIMIFGRSGSGKSTFALKLSRLLHLPLYHIDRYFFVANWVERNYQEFLAIQQKIVNEDCWIIDGNSTKSLEMRYARANLVLYFNFPRWLCYWRVVKRLFNKDPAIQDRAEGCKERVSWSLLSYMWSYEKRVAKLINQLRADYPNVRFIEINSDKQLGFLVSKLFIAAKTAIDRAYKN